MKITAVDPFVVELPHPRPLPQGVVAAAGAGAVPDDDAGPGPHGGRGRLGTGRMGGDARDAVAMVTPALLGADSAWLQAHAPAIEAARRVGGGTWPCATCSARKPASRWRALWGICRDRIRAYVSPVVGKAGRRTGRRRGALSRGGLHGDQAAHVTGRPWPRTSPWCRRSASGSASRWDILVDANLAGRGGAPARRGRPGDYARARDTACELHQLGVGWLEEPLPRGDVAAIARLTGEAELAIAGGEGDRGTAAFARLLDARRLRTCCSPTARPARRCRRCARSPLPRSSPAAASSPHHGAVRPRPGRAPAALRDADQQPVRGVHARPAVPDRGELPAAPRHHHPEPIGIDADGMVRVPLGPRPGSRDRRVPDRALPRRLSALPSRGGTLNRSSSSTRSGSVPLCLAHAAHDLARHAEPGRFRRNR